LWFYWIIYRLIAPLTGKILRSRDQSMENEELLNLDEKKQIFTFFIQIFTFLFKFSHFDSNFHFFIRTFTLLFKFSLFYSNCHILYSHFNVFIQHFLFLYKFSHFY
jgi:hypothetical protein